MTSPKPKRTPKIKPLKPGSAIPFSKMRRRTPSPVFTQDDFDCELDKVRQEQSKELLLVLKEEEGRERKRNF
jgi:hypothetical protein